MAQDHCRPRRTLDLSCSQPTPTPAPSSSLCLQMNERGDGSRMRTQVDASAVLPPGTARERRAAERFQPEFELPPSSAAARARSQHPGGIEAAIAEKAAEVDAAAAEARASFHRLLTDAMGGTQHLWKVRCRRRLCTRGRAACCSASQLGGHRLQAHMQALLTRMLPSHVHRRLMSLTSRPRATPSFTPCLTACSRQTPARRRTGRPPP
jgi:hypothetical protein